MISGINDTKSVKKTIGARLQQAREGKNASRKDVVDLLNAHPQAPSFKATKLLQEGTYKKWEYGENPVQLEWIPALCEVLDCDIGYLFGEYEERHRTSADIAAETGLTECAIQKLQSIKLRNPEYPPVISVLIEDFNCEYLLNLIYNRFLYSALEYNVPPITKLENGAWHLKNAREFHASISASETKIQFDNVILNAKKKTLLDSMISTAVIGGMKDMADVYISRKKGDENNG